MTLLRHGLPSKSFNNLMVDLFNDSTSLLSSSYVQGSNHFPPVNITENDGSYVLSLIAPGFEKDSFSIDLDKNLLTLSAKTKTETSNDQKLRTEFKASGFKRSFTIDENIDVENISAKYINGVLILTLPKKVNVEAPAKKITIA